MALATPTLALRRFTALSDNSLFSHMNKRVKKKKKKKKKRRLYLPISEYSYTGCQNRQEPNKAGHLL